MENLKISYKRIVGWHFVFLAQIQIRIIFAKSKRQKGGNSKMVTDKQTDIRTFPFNIETRWRHSRIRGKFGSSAVR